MKLLLALVAFIGALIVYKIYTTPPPAPQVVYAPTATPAPLPTATPIPRHLTPEGTFYVTQYSSVRTAKGIVGFEPGRMVKFVSANEAKGTLTVSDGEYQAELTPMQLTNDIDLAVLAQRQDQASQQQLLAVLESERRADEKIRMQNDVNYAQDVARVRTTSSVGGGHSTLDAESKPASAADRAVIQYGNPYYYLHRSVYYTY